MKRALKRNKNASRLINAKNLTGDTSNIYGDAKFLRGNVSEGLYGDVSGLRGYVSGLRGDVTGLRGDIDDCELSDDERKAGVNIEALIERLEEQGT